MTDEQVDHGIYVPVDPQTYVPVQASEKHSTLKRRVAATTLLAALGVGGALAYTYTREPSLASGPEDSPDLF